MITRRFTITAIRSDAYILYHNSSITWAVLKSQITTDPGEFSVGDEVDLTWDDDQDDSVFANIVFDEIAGVS